MGSFSSKYEIILNRDRQTRRYGEWDMYEQLYELVWNYSLNIMTRRLKVIDHGSFCGCDYVCPVSPGTYDEKYSIPWIPLPNPVIGIIHDYLWRWQYDGRWAVCIYYYDGKTYIDIPFIYGPYDQILPPPSPPRRPVNEILVYDTDQLMTTDP
jgi:hypothetical protein